jgi:hypothetical protein
MAEPTPSPTASATAASLAGRLRDFRSSQFLPSSSIHALGMGERKQVHPAV